MRRAAILLRDRPEGSSLRYLSTVRYRLAIVCVVGIRVGISLCDMG